MNTLPMSLTSVISRADEPLTAEQIGYLQAYAQDNAHDLVLRTFLSLPEDEKITRAFLARRLNKAPEQITRWLAVPGNWTLGTFADLLGAMGYLPIFGAKPMRDVYGSNYLHPFVTKLVESAPLPLPKPEHFTRRGAGTDSKATLGLSNRNFDQHRALEIAE